MARTVAGVHPLVHKHFKLAPNGVPARPPILAVFQFRADPYNLVVPDGAGATFPLSVPFVISPCSGIRRVCPIFGVAAIPISRPLHQQLVVGIRAHAAGGTASRQTPARTGAVKS